MTSNYTDVMESSTWLASTAEEVSVARVPVTAYWQFRVHEHLFLYISPVLLVAGALGNMTTLVVLHTEAFKRAPSSVVLSALAVADTTTLYTGLFRHWLRMVASVDVRYLTHASCKSHFFFTYLSRQLSSGYLMLISMERAASVLFPLKIKMICTRKRMMMIVAGYTACLVLVNSHSFFTMTLHHKPTNTGTVKICDKTEEAEDFMSGAFYWIDSTIAMFIPIGMIALCNAIIISKIAASQRMRRETTSGTTKTNSITSTTVMLVVIGLGFLLLTLPSCIYFLGIGQKTWPLKTPKDIAKIYFVYSIVNLLYYTNSSINFILYSLSGTKFRKTLRRLFCGPAKDARQQSMSMSGTAISNVDTEYKSRTQSESRF